MLLYIIQTNTKYTPNKVKKRNEKKKTVRMELHFFGRRRCGEAVSVKRQSFIRSINKKNALKSTPSVYRD